ncbi:MAG: TadE/TadG family type IV pilus assembly protein [Terracidiphilus sp.]
MKRFGVSFLRRFLRNQRGQTVVAVMITAATVMSLAAASVETGHVYYAYQQLVASTNSAALAGAEAMPNTTQASTNVTTYSAQSNGMNATAMLQNVTATPAFLCLSTVSNGLNVPCQTSTGGSGGYNAMSVTQTATIPLWFGGLVGMKKMNVSYTAEAAMAGGQNLPWNIAVIVDTTSSMNTSDGGDQCSGTRITCALLGVQALLNDLYPCGLGQTCTNAGATPFDSVSLFVFPAVTGSTAPDDSKCPQSNPTIVSYTFPDPPSNTTLPSADTYQVDGFANNYKTSDSASSLNQAAGIVIAAGDSGQSNCSGIQAPGGEGTYYAQVIYAAQAALLLQQATNPGSQNAIILLTDGDATACASNANTTAGACDTKSQLLASEGTLNGTGTKTSNPSGYESYAYPSALGMCGQAVLAAQAAANAGTTVYTIGYGSPTSGGCLSDKTYSATVGLTGRNWGPGDQPCQALAAMASSAVNFYSDDGSGCQATAPTNQNLTKLTAIFRAITDNMSSPRLIPTGST